MAKLTQQQIDNVLNPKKDDELDEVQLEGKK